MWEIFNNFCLCKGGGGQLIEISGDHNTGLNFLSQVSDQSYQDD